MSTQAPQEQEGEQQEKQESWTPTSDGVERKVSTVHHRIRYGKMERDRALLASGLVDQESDLPVSAVGRGLGGKTRDGKDNRVPERIPGWAVLHPDLPVTDKNRYRRYDSAFYRSLMGDCTMAVRIVGAEGKFDTERRVHPQRLAHYCNHNIFFSEVMGPEELGYVISRQRDSFREHLAPSKFKGKVEPEGVKRAYTVFARLLVMPHLKRLKSPQQGLCLLCGGFRKDTCEDCDVSVRRATHHSPLQTATLLTKSAHRLFHDRAANAVVEAFREEIARLFPFDHQKVREIVPTKKQLWGRDPAIVKYLDFCENTDMMPRDVRAPMPDHDHAHDQEDAEGVTVDAEGAEKES